jgi:phosphoglycerate dehydrogenase-like enzyme
MSGKIPSAFFGIESLIEKVFSCGRRETIADLTDLYPQVVGVPNFEDHAKALENLEVIFSTWGMPALSAEQISRLPRLKAVFYAAGTVKEFAKPFLDAGILVTSAAAANAVPVARFTLAHVLLGLKGWYRNVREYNEPGKYKLASRGPGIFEQRVAILGAGAIGGRVIELLRPMGLQIQVFDPFLDESRAARLGVEKISLAEAFQQAQVVSNHLADLPETRNMISKDHFASMREGAVFINTGRGWTVNTEAMLDVVSTRPDLTMILDVSRPEPPEVGSPLYHLPNVHLSSHIAGSIGEEPIAMADHALEEFRIWASGGIPNSSISAEMLARMA